MKRQKTFLVLIIAMVFFIPVALLNLAKTKEAIGTTLVNIIPEQADEWSSEDLDSGGNSVDENSIALNKRILNEKVENVQQKSEKFIAEKSVETSAGTLQIQQAIVETKKKNYAEAERIYREMLAENPNHQVAAINLGLLLKKQQQYEQAEKVLSGIVDVASGRRKGKAMALLADVYADSHQAEKAVPLFKKAIEYRPSHKLTWLNLSKAMHQAGYSWQETSGAFEKALALDPTNSKTRLVAAKYELESLNFKKAIGYLKSGKKQLKNQREFHEYLAWCYALLGQDAKAVPHFKWLVDHEEDERQLINYQLATKVLRNNASRAIKQIESRKVLSGEDYLLYLLAIEHLDDSKILNAKLTNQFSKVIYKNSTKDTNLNFKNIVLWKNAVTSEQPIRALESLYQAPVYRLNLTYEISLLAMKSGDKNKALNMAMQAVKMSGKSAKMTRHLAKVHQQFGENAQAIELLEKLVKDKPKSKLSKKLLAKVYLDSNQPEKVIAVLKTIPDKKLNLDDRYVLAKAHSIKGDFKQANPLLISVMEEDSKHLLARLQLAQNFCHQKQFMSCEKEAKRVLKLDKHNKQALSLKETAVSGA